MINVAVAFLLRLAAPAVAPWGQDINGLPIRCPCDGYPGFCTARRFLEDAADYLEATT